MADHAAAPAAQAYTLVDFHCHSDQSDGYFSPETLGYVLADARVRFAALADHDSLAGLERFQRTAARNGIPTITGLEVCATLGGREIHLLAYGVDPRSRALSGLIGTATPAGEAIARIHDAGGLAFLAHPLDQGLESLDEALAAFKGAGLDGLEAYYKPYPEEVRNQLAALADRHGLLTSAGSDFHGPSRAGASEPGIPMPTARWKHFRAALGDRVHSSAGSGALHASPRRELDWRWFFARIVIPSLLVVGFFAGLLFGIVIPTKRTSLLERKREMIAELANSAWSILAHYAQGEQQGTMSREQAQADAVERIRALRYGRDAKDYFWITDMHPRMIMHPYRPDLEGQDLSGLTDSDGVRPFVEFADTVREHDRGYVHYSWQWHDVPEQIAAKESYVRAFRPWGWVIGTGMYVEDVQADIEAITRRVVNISVIFTCLITLLLVVVAYQSLKVERRRSEAERELQAAHDRYRALVESSSEGILLVLDHRLAYANRTMLEMLGCRFEDLRFLDIDDLLVFDDGRQADERMGALASGNGANRLTEALLKRKDGEAVAVLVSVTPVSLTQREGLIIGVREKGAHRLSEGELMSDLASQVEASLQFLNEPVRNSMGPPLSCGADTTISQAVVVMAQRRSSAIAVTGAAGEPIGIVTDHDLRERVLAAGLDPRRPVSDIMSSPVAWVNEASPLYEAFLLQRQRGVHHLAVRDSAGALAGLLDNHQLLRLEALSPVVLAREIRRARTAGEVAGFRERLAPLVGSLVDAGAAARSVCHITTAASDAVTERLIGFALDELGPPPVSFAFIALGSEGRKEQTLATDQDNAIIYAQPPRGEEPEAAAYFSNLGERVCMALNQAGYAFCQGEVMARNPKWCQPLAAWKETFARWIAEAKAEELMKFSAFFDFRRIRGETTLTRELRRHIHTLSSSRPAFFQHLAQEVLSYRPPVGLFGRIVTGASAGPPHTFDVKQALRPIVGFARLYALRRGLEETNTLERIEELGERDELHEDTCRGAYQACECLMKLRFEHQVRRLRADLPPDNAIDPRGLSQIELAMLRQAFHQISVLQKKVSLEFRGTT